jgi:hypothetical protein
MEMRRLEWYHLQVVGEEAAVVVQPHFVWLVEYEELSLLSVVVVVVVVRLVLVFVLVLLEYCWCCLMLGSQTHQLLRTTFVLWIDTNQHKRAFGRWTPQLVPLMTYLYPQHRHQ